MTPHAQVSLAVARLIKDTEHFDVERELGKVEFLVNQQGTFEDLVLLFGELPHDWVFVALEEHLTVERATLTLNLVSKVVIIKDLDAPITVMHHGVLGQVIDHLRLPVGNNFRPLERVVASQAVRDAALVHVDVDRVFGLGIYRLDVDGFELLQVFDRIFYLLRCNLDISLPYGCDSCLILVLLRLDRAQEVYVQVIRHSFRLYYP